MKGYIWKIDYGTEGYAYTTSATPTTGEIAYSAMRSDSDNSTFVVDTGSTFPISEIWENTDVDSVMESMTVVTNPHSEFPPSVPAGTYKYWGKGYKTNYDSGSMDFPAEFEDTGATFSYFDIYANGGNYITCDVLGMALIYVPLSKDNDDNGLWKPGMVIDGTNREKALYLSNFAPKTKKAINYSKKKIVFDWDGETYDTYTFDGWGPKNFPHWTINEDETNTNSIEESWVIFNSGEGNLSIKLKRGYNVAEFASERRGQSAAHYYLALYKKNKQIKYTVIAQIIWK